MEQLPALPNPSTQWSEPQLDAPKLREALRTAIGSTNQNYLEVLDRDEIAEIRRVAAEYERGLVGTPDHLIAEVMALLATAFPSQRRSDTETEAKLELYLRGLRDVPYDALKLGCESLLKSQNWFPTIAEMRQAAAPHFEPRRQALFACRALILRHERDYQEPEVEKTDWTQIEVEEANADFRRAGVRTRFRLDPDNPGRVVNCQAIDIGEEPLEPETQAAE